MEYDTLVLSFPLSTIIEYSIFESVYWIINATLCLVYFLTVCNRIFLIAFLHLIRTLKREIEHKIKKIKIKKSLSLVKPC